MITAHIIVTPKRSVLDPQGEAVKKALQALGLEKVREVRIGKFIELEIQEAPTPALQEKLEAACRDLLSNPVIEDYLLNLAPEEVTPTPAEVLPEDPARESEAELVRLESKPRKAARKIAKAVKKVQVTAKPRTPGRSVHRQGQNNAARPPGQKRTIGQKAGKTPLGQVNVSFSLIMRWAILQFPGSNCDQDCWHVLKNVLQQDAYYVWHKDTSLQGADAVVIPGGFSYGDYLRCGAIARFSPIMQAVREAEASGAFILGICNGFQILCEAGFLPGALIRNRNLHFLCEHVHLRVERADSAFTRLYEPKQVLRIPIAHGEGSYFAEPATLAELEAHQQVLFRYCDPAGQSTDAANPNGTLNHIAGLMNRRGNVCGLMPHPERAAEAILGSTDGAGLFQSLMARS